jgi:hypothetical protein
VARPDRGERRWGEGMTAAKMAACRWLDPFIVAASSFWSGYPTIDYVIPAFKLDLFSSQLS